MDKVHGTIPAIEAMTTPNFEQEADWATEKAAQCWCDPTVSDRLMDPELCFVIAQALRAAYEKGRLWQCTEAGMTANWKHGHDLGFEACREAAAKVVEQPIGEKADGGGRIENCYGCDCHGEVPQEYYPPLIRALTPTNTSETSTEGK